MSGNFREPVVPEGAPLLYRSWANYPMYNFSYSLADDIDTCGEKTINKRFIGLTKKLESAAFKFGICCEESVVENLRLGSDPESVFASKWMKFKDIELEYSSRDVSWSRLLEVGKALMRCYLHKKDKPPFVEILSNVQFSLVLPEDQRAVWYNGTRLDYIADMVSSTPSGRMIIDMKTAGSTFEEDVETKGYPALDPQLQTGSLASGMTADGFKPELVIRRVGFIALIKTKTPNVEFVEGYVTDKMLESRDAWLREQYHKLLDRKLFMRTGVRWPKDHCKMCEYLPKCLGNQELVEKTLRVKQSKETAKQLLVLDED